jgi:hypothetical protein
MSIRWLQESEVSIQKDSLHFAVTKHESEVNIQKTIFSHKSPSSMSPGLYL